MKTVAKAACLVLALALTACATQKRSAPVVDRGPGRPAVAETKPSAPAAAPQPVQSSQSVKDGFYMVKRGDTLYSIALEHGADYREVAQWNSLDDPTRLRVGQLLRVRPPEERVAVQVGPARGAGRVEARPLETQALPSASQPAPQRVQQAGAKPEARAEPKLEPKPEPKPEPARAEGESVDFVWPAKGKILAGFAEPRSKGIDIEGKLGDPVVAAAAGRVTYIGTGIPGLGKLVVIKHENGFLTVYAHNKQILVKEQQSVARGQKIAELGSSDSSRPKLHFQIRKGASAVDPLKYLPAI